MQRGRRRRRGRGCWRRSRSAPRQVRRAPLRPPPSPAGNCPAAAALAMGIDQPIDRRLEAGLRQRLDYRGAFPFSIALGAPVLQRAAAAGTEMRTDRFDARKARGIEPDEAPAIRMTGPWLNLG